MSGPAPFTFAAFLGAWYEACAKEWDIPDPVTGVRGEPLAVLPEGVFPGVTEIVSPVTRSVVKIKRVPMFPRGPGPSLVLPEFTDEQVAEFRERFAEAMKRPWHHEPSPGGHAGGTCATPQEDGTCGCGPRPEPGNH